jgi:hypothetical protein
VSNTASGFVADIVKRLPAKKNTLRNRLVMESAARKWVRDPFVPMEMRREKNAATAGAATPLFTPDVAYTGYLQFGNRRLAVINKMEYEQGEIIEPGEYILKEVFPDRVTLGSLAGNKSFTIMLEETEAYPGTPSE